MYNYPYRDSDILDILIHGYEENSQHSNVSIWSKHNVSFFAKINLLVSLSRKLVPARNPLGAKIGRI